MSPHNPIEAGKRGQVTAEGFGDVTCAKGPCARGAESEVYSSSPWQAGVQMTNPRSDLAGNGARRSNPFLCPTSTPQGQTQQPRWVRPWWVPPAQVLVAVLVRLTLGTAMPPPGWSIPPFPPPPNPPTAIWDGRDLGSAGAVLQHHRPGSADPAGTALDTGIAPKDGNVFPKCCSDLGRGQGRRIACQISSRHVNAAGSK